MAGIGDNWNTRQTVRVSGQYRCQGCGLEITCVEGKRFPPCGVCDAAVAWELVDITGQADTEIAVEKVVKIEEPKPLGELALEYIGPYRHAFIADFGVFVHNHIYTRAELGAAKFDRLVGGIEAGGVQGFRLVRR